MTGAICCPFLNFSYNTPIIAKTRLKMAYIRARANVCCAFHWHFALIFTHARGVPRVLMGVARCWRGGKHGRRESLPSCATCSFLHAQNPANTNPSQGEGALTRNQRLHSQVRTRAHLYIASRCVRFWLRQNFLFQPAANKRERF